MKKIFILLILLCIVLLNCYNNQSEFTLSNYFQTGKITKYIDEERCNTLIGESIYLDTIEIDSALNNLNATIKFAEYIADKDLTILYCNSPLINKTIVVKAETINLQIALTDEYTVIGWPMILGSF